MRVVFDTNVYVAGALKPGGLSAQLLDRVLDRNSGYVLFASREIMEELESRLTALSPNVAGSFLSIIRGATRFVEIKERLNTVKADPDDNKILECAIAAEANLIVSMDKHLLKLKEFRGIPIVHPNTIGYMLPGT